MYLESKVFTPGTPNKTRRATFVIAIKSHIYTVCPVIN